MLAQVQYLRVGDRIMEHLTRLHVENLNDGDVWPFEATQTGIAAAIGKTRAHVALEVKRLEARGKVVPMLAHVRGNGNPRRARLLVYKPGNGVLIELLEESGKVHRLVPGTVEELRIVKMRCPSCGHGFRIALA